MKKVLFLSLFWCLWYLAFCSRTSLSPLLPVIEDEMGLSHALAGGLYLALSIGYTLSLLISGILAPRLGYKRSILLGHVALAAAFICPWFARDYAVLVGIFFFVGAGSGLYLPSAIPLLTRLFDARNWGKAIAIHDTAASISILSIPFLTTLALHYLNWRGFFLILSGSCLLMAALFCLIVPDARPQANEERGRLGLILRRPEFWVMVLMWCMAATGSMGLYSIMPLFLVKGKEIPLDTANTLFGLSRIGGAIATLLAGFLADRFGVRRVLIFLFLITGASTMGIALAPSFLVLVVMLFIQAPMSTGFFPVGLVALSKLSGEGERSMFTGATLAIGTIVGIGLAPLCLGAAADIWSFQSGILVTGCVILAAGRASVPAQGHLTRGQGDPLRVPWDRTGRPQDPAGECGAHQFPWHGPHPRSILFMGTGTPGAQGPSPHPDRQGPPVPRVRDLRGPYKSRKPAEGRRRIPDHLPLHPPRPGGEAGAVPRPERVKRGDTWT